LVENIHKENILRETIAPARVTENVAKKAEAVAEKTMSVLKGAGIFGIEMFVTQEENIMINEIAPRVHNSGHHTLQSSETSQFEQHLRAIMGLDLGGTKLIHNTVMHNILGAPGFTGKYDLPNISENGVFLKMYGKEISKPLRKLGHVNMVGHKGESVEELLKKLHTLKQNFTIRASD
jgi:5-(carboxyamino)imidazole ribonucleotide synthase